MPKEISDSTCLHETRDRSKCSRAAKKKGLCWQHYKMRFPEFEVSKKGRRKKYKGTPDVGAAFTRWVDNNFSSRVCVVSGDYREIANNSLRLYFYVQYDLDSNVRQYALFNFLPRISSSRTRSTRISKSVPRTRIVDSLQSFSACVSSRMESIQDMQTCYCTTEKRT